MEKLKRLFNLFLTFFKIGLFTFGGGYAMIAVIEREIIEKKGWISHEEFLDVIAIAESTPGPLAVNSATYIGYKIAGIFGSLFATLGVVLPSFLIIFTISFFFDKFIHITWVSYAFKGIQACVVFLILNAGIKMQSKIKKTAFNLTLFILTLIALITLELLAVNFSSIFFILIGGLIGLIVYLIGYFKNKNTSDKNDNGGKR
ncbi:MAG: chromate transporter [Clostridia bacterium]|nr:chromate transporter [Clostridia bacterium]